MIENTFLKSAISYARLGWAVFPLSPKTKIPFKDSNGYKDATKDETEITRIWTKWPDANVGVATGKISDLIILDIDDPKIKFDSPLPRTRIVSTGKGFHYYFRSNGVEIPRQIKVSGKDYDILAEGGYALVPPSVHPSGKPYEVYFDLDPTEEIPDFPMWLCAKENGNGKTPYEEIVKGLPEGSRNTNAVRVVGAMVKFFVEKGIVDEKTILDGALAANKNHKPPLPENEIASMVKRMLGKELGKPNGKNKTPQLSEIADSMIEENKIISTPMSGDGSGIDILVYKNGYYQKGVISELGKAIDLRLGDSSTEEKILNVFNLIRRRSAVEFSKINLKAKDLINVENGMVNWRTGELLPHSSDYLSTFQIKAVFNPEVIIYEPVLKFIQDVFPEGALWLAGEMLGYFMLPGNPYQKAFFLYGSGANGKGTYINIVEEMLGFENISSVALEAITQERFASSALFGKLVNACADIDYRAIGKSNLFKQIVACDYMTAEKKYSPSFSFKPYCKLLFSANQMPATGDKTEAFFRRLIIVPFDRVFKGVGEDRNILSKLTTPEARSCWLNIAIQGLIDLEDRGAFKSCPATLEVLDEYREDVDGIYRFCKETLMEEDGQFVVTNELYENYRKWCEINGSKYIDSKVWFIRRLVGLYGKDRVGVQKRVNGKNMKIVTGLSFNSVLSL